MTSKKVGKRETKDAQGTIEAAKNTERGTVLKSRWTCTAA